MATVTIINEDGIGEASTIQALKNNKTGTLNPKQPADEKAGVAVQHPLNAKIIWAEIKAKPNGKIRPFDRLDLYAMISHAMDLGVYKELDVHQRRDADSVEKAAQAHKDRVAFLRLLQTNEKARRIVIAAITGERIEDNQNTTTQELNIDENYDVNLSAAVKIKLETAFRENEQFTRELFLLAPKAAQLLSAEKLKELMLANKGAAMAIAQNPEFAIKLKGIQFTKDEIIKLLATQPDPKVPWQTKDHAYHAALLNFSLRYHRRAFNASGLLANFSKTLDDNDHSEEANAIRNLRTAFHAISPELAVNFIAGVENPIGFLRAHNALLSDAQVMHATALLMNRGFDVVDYLDTRLSDRVTIASRLKSAVKTQVSNPQQDPAGNKVLLAIVQDPQLRAESNFTDSDAVRWLERSKFNPLISRQFAREKGFFAGLSDSNKDKLKNGSPYFQAAATMENGVTAASGGLFNRSKVQTVNYCHAFIDGNNLDQGICFLLAGNHWQTIIDHLQYDYYLFGLIPWKRPAAVIQQKMKLLGEQSPFFESIISGKSLAELALDPHYQEHFIAALKRPGAEILIIETLRTATAEQLAQFKLIPALSTDLILSDQFNLIPNHLKLRLLATYRTGKSLAELALDPHYQEHFIAALKQPGAEILIIETLRTATPEQLARLLNGDLKRVLVSSKMFDSISVAMQSYLALQYGFTDLARFKRFLGFAKDTAANQQQVDHLIAEYRRQPSNVRKLMTVIYELYWHLVPPNLKPKFEAAYYGLHLAEDKTADGGLKLAVAYEDGKKERNEASSTHTLETAPRAKEGNDHSSTTSLSAEDLAAALKPDSIAFTENGVDGRPANATELTPMSAPKAKPGEGAATPTHSLSDDGDGVMRKLDFDEDSDPAAALPGVALSPTTSLAPSTTSYAASTKSLSPTGSTTTLSSMPAASPAGFKGVFVPPPPNANAADTHQPGSPGFAAGTAPSHDAHRTAPTPT